MTNPASTAAEVGLLDALLRRRSRRMAEGLELTGPLAFTSQQPPRPLSLEDEALLAFAANGVTGFIAADLPYRDADGGASTTSTARFARRKPWMNRAGAARSS